MNNLAVTEAVDVDGSVTIRQQPDRFAWTRSAWPSETVSATPVPTTAAARSDGRASRRGRVRRPAAAWCEGHGASLVQPKQHPRRDGEVKGQVGRARAPIRAHWCAHAPAARARSPQEFDNCSARIESEPGVGGRELVEHVARPLWDLDGRQGYAGGGECPLGLRCPLFAACASSGSTPRIRASPFAAALYSRQSALMRRDFREAPAARDPHPGERRRGNVARRKVATSARSRRFQAGSSKCAVFRPRLPSRLRLRKSDGSG
jgi:hypothetical protein